MISFKRIIQITIPLIVGGLSTNLVNLTDTIFLSWLGEIELGSAGNGAIFYFIFVYVGMGISSGMQILIARRNGEKSYAEIGNYLQSGVFMLLIYSVAAAAIIVVSMNTFIPALYKSAAIASGTHEYLSYRVFGLFFTLFAFAMMAFFVGITKTKVLSWAIPIAALLNIVLDYLFIFGMGPIPSLGIKGAAIASVMSEGAGGSILLIYALKYYRKGEINILIKPELMKERMTQILRLSYPLMAQNFITRSGWFLVFSLVERLGERELAVTHILRSIYGFLMLPAFSLADAANSLVSNALGEKKVQEVFPLIMKVGLLGIIFSLVCIVLNMRFEKEILSLYTDDESMIQMASGSYLIINVALTVLTVSMILLRSLTGTGLTKLSLIIEIVAVVFYVSYSVSILNSSLASLEWLWSSEFVYFGIIASLSFLYLRFGGWKLKAI